MSELSEMALRESKHVIFHGHTAWDYRCACNGEGELGRQWKDKPHRIVYDLLRVIDTIPAKDATIAAQQQEIERLRERSERLAICLRESVDVMAECNAQYPFEEGEWNGECPSGHEFECGRCEIKRRSENILAAYRAEQSNLQALEKGE